MSITDLAKPEFWQQLLSSDFNRGYIAGLGLVIALLVFLFIITLFLFFPPVIKRVRAR